jgi:methionyl-tRNA formyltransferase
MASTPIAHDATSGDMERVLASLGANLLIPVVDALAEGHAPETPQNHARATFAPKIAKDDGAIDWTRPARAIHNQIRGLQPWPLAATTLHGGRLLLRRSSPEDRETSIPPGAIVRAAGGDLLVACGNGSVLRILELQPEGRRTMTAREFLAGRGIANGDRFGS